MPQQRHHGHFQAPRPTSQVAAAQRDCSRQGLPSAPLLDAGRADLPHAPQPEPRLPIFLSRAAAARTSHPPRPSTYQPQLQFRLNPASLAHFHFPPEP